MSGRESGPVPKRDRRAESKPVRSSKGDHATTEVFSRKKGEDAAPAKVPLIESAPIGLRKASIPESGRVREARGSDFDLPRPASGTGQRQKIDETGRRARIDKADTEDTGRRPRVDKAELGDDTGRRPKVELDARHTSAKHRSEPVIVTRNRGEVEGDGGRVARSRGDLDSAPARNRQLDSAGTKARLERDIEGASRARKAADVVSIRKRDRDSGPVAMVIPARWRRALRRAGKVSVGATGAVLACIGVAIGGVDGASLMAAHMPLPQAMVATAISALVVIAVIRRAQFTEPTARAQRVSMWLAAAQDLADLELALALVAGLHVVIAVTGGLSSPAYPALYGLVAFSVTVLARPGAFATLGAALFLEAALLVRTGISEPAILDAGLHGLFIAGAAAAHAVLLRGLTSRYRQRRSKRLEEELSALRDSARDYRLIAAALGPDSRAPRAREEEEKLLAIGGVGMIGDAMSWVLSTLKNSLGARTVALLWVEDSDGDGV
jgi:hypothetical protein